MKMATRFGDGAGPALAPRLSFLAQRHAASPFGRLRAQSPSRGGNPAPGSIDTPKLHLFYGMACGL